MTSSTTTSSVAGGGGGGRSYYNKSCVSPILRRVFSRSTLYVQTPRTSAVPPKIMTSSTNDLRRSESRISTSAEMASIRSGSSGGKGDLCIDVSTEENVQFMDQPLRGKIELSG